MIGIPLLALYNEKLMKVSKEERTLYCWKIFAQLIGGLKDLSCLNIRHGMIDP